MFEEAVNQDSEIISKKEKEISLPLSFKMK